MVESFKISATYLELQAPFTSLLLAQNKQGIVGTIYLFSSKSSSSLRATFILNRSEASTTNMIPSIRFAVQLAFSCQKLRYFDWPDMSNTSKSTPLRVKVCFLNPIVGVIQVSILPGSIIRDSTVVLPLLSSPTNSIFPQEFPITTLPFLYYYSNQANRSIRIQKSILSLQAIIYYNSFQISPSKMKASDPSKLHKKNQNLALAQALIMGTERMKDSDKIIFLTGFCCSLAGLVPDAAGIGLMKNAIHNVNEANSNEFISYTNFIEILVQSSRITSKLRGTLNNQKIMQKFSSRVENLIGQVVDNRRHIRQKWMREQKLMVGNRKHEQQKMDEQTKRLIQSIQLSDLKNQNNRKIKEKENQDRALQFIKEEELLENERIREKMQRQYEKIKCEICLQDIPYTEIGALSCGHIFHKSCVRSHIEALVNEKKVDIPCPAACGAYLPLIDVQEFIDGELKQKYDKFCFDLFVEKNEKDTSWCPTAGCTAVFSHDGVLDNYRCPVCRKHYCLNCRCDFHTGMSCAEYRISNSYGENDKKFDEFVIGAKFKQCPKCKFWVERSAGCNSMTCRCGNVFCYDCGGPACPHGSCSNSGRK